MREIPAASDRSPIAIAESESELGSGVPTTAAVVAVIWAPGSSNRAGDIDCGCGDGFPAPSPGPANVPMNCAGVMVLSNMNPVTLVPGAIGAAASH